MIDYINETLFRTDSVTKNWYILGDGIELDNESIYSESTELTESICSESNMIFGSCVASTFKFTTSDITTSYKDKAIYVSVVLNGDDENPFTLGTFYVDAEKLSADRTKKDIVAYDGIYKIINTDVSEWYNELTFPMTLSDFRESLFIYFGIPVVNTTLVNDSMTIEKTIDVQELSGAEVLKAICEINGVFGHINRSGEFEFKSLSTTSVYSVTPTMYSYCVYEDYSVQVIDKLQIRQEEGDIGVVVGSGDNDYIVEDNFLVYGKGTEELTTIANNLLGSINNISYVPCTIDCIGNPCVEVGDRITLTKTNGDTVTTYVMNRTLKGLQALFDEYSAEGDETYPDNVNGVQYDIRQLKGKSNVLTRTIEQTNSRITNVEAGLRTEITQTAEGLQIQIEDLQSQMDGEVAYYEREGVPTLLNYPYWDFCTNIPCNNTVQTTDDLQFVYTEQNRKDHRSDICYDTTNNLGYRFVNENGSWFWKEIADTDYTLIMSRLATLEATAEHLQSVYEEQQVQINEQGVTLVQHTSQLSQTSSSITLLTRRVNTHDGDIETLESTLSVQASQISAKVSQTGGSSSSFSWYLKSDKFELKSNNNVVFRCNSSGITINGNGTFSGQVTASSGAIGGWTISSGSLTKTSGNYTIAIQGDGTLLCKQGNTVKWALQNNGDVQFAGNCAISGNATISGYSKTTEISATYATISSLNSTNARIGNLESIAITTNNLSAQSISAGQITTGTLNADRIAGNSITVGKLNSASFKSSRVDVGTIACTNSYIIVGGRTYSQTWNNTIGAYILTAPYN